MPSQAFLFLRCIGALLLLEAVTWLVEVASFLFLWRAQSLAPYAFFPNQSWDFLAKIRWHAAPLLDWAPRLPDRFAGEAMADKLAALAPLLPSTLATALVVGAIGGLACALLSRRRGSLRGDVLAWALVALLVHVAASLPAFQLDEGLRIGRLAFRARSLVVDGMLLATGISIVSCAAALAVAPLLARSRAIAALAAAATMLAAGLATTQAAPPPPVVTAAVPATAAAAPRNVVLISLDSLRADHVGAYGYRRDTTPAFDRFAKEGVLFRNAISTSSWTLPTHMTMFTGLSQLSHGVFADTLVLARSVRTLGEIFHDAGYATAGFVSGPYLAGHYGYERGMDRYVDLSASWGKGAEARAAVLSPQINENALAWLDQPHQAPFFLFLHYFDIHYDYIPPSPWDRKFDPDYTGSMDGRFFIERSEVNPKMNPRDLEHIVALYDGEIGFTDSHVGRVLDRLREKGLMDSTVVMIVADHGDEFFEHGNKGHHRTVYDEVLHIPMALRLPGGVQAGKAVDAQVSLIDVFPTLLSAAGLSIPAGAEGQNLLGQVRGDAPERGAIYSDFYDKKGLNLQVARRTPAAKTIQHFNRITHPKRGALEYYDLASDPAERDDRGAQHQGELRASVEMMTAWLDQQWRMHRSVEAAAGGSGSIEIDEETKNRLRSLGYAGD